MVQRVFPNRVFRGFNSIGKTRPSTELHDIELIKRDILNHFYTHRGERVMRPGFGSIIWELLFNPFDDILRDQVLSDVDRIISSEPRVELISSDVIEYEHGLRINLKIKYIPYESIGNFSVNFDRRNNIQTTTETSLDEL